MDDIAPSPQTTLGILLGASEWPYANLVSSPAFARSAHRVREYFLYSGQFRIRPENWLDLFDTHLNSPDEIDRAMSTFLQKRLARMKQEGTPARDLLFYYIGHGMLAFGPHQAFHLAIRSTDDQRLRSSAIAMAALADTLKTNARYLRRFVILDCCFAAKSLEYMMQSGLDQAFLTQTISDFEEKSISTGFPRKGTALLCSSGSKYASLLLPDASGTMFSEALIRALHQGNTREQGKTHLSLYDLKKVIEEVLEKLEDGKAPRPFVSSPDQSDGDVASIPFFPNPRFEEEQRRKAEEEREYAALVKEQAYKAAKERLAREAEEAEQARLAKIEEEQRRKAEEEREYAFLKEQAQKAAEERLAREAEEAEQTRLAQKEQARKAEEEQAYQEEVERIRRVREEKKIQKRERERLRRIEEEKERKVREEQVRKAEEEKNRLIKEAASKREVEQEYTPPAAFLPQETLPLENRPITIISGPLIEEYTPPEVPSLQGTTLSENGLITRTPSWVAETQTVKSSLITPIDGADVLRRVRDQMYPSTWGVFSSLGGDVGFFALIRDVVVRSAVFSLICFIGLKVFPTSPVWIYTLLACLYWIAYFINYYRQKSFVLVLMPYGFVYGRRRKKEPSLVINFQEVTAMSVLFPKDVMGWISSMGLTWAFAKQIRNRLSVFPHGFLNAALLVRLSTGTGETRTIVQRLYYPREIFLTIIDMHTWFKANSFRLDRDTIDTL